MLAHTSTHHSGTGMTIHGYSFTGYTAPRPHYVVRAGVKKRNYHGNYTQY